MVTEEKRAELLASLEKVSANIKDKTIYRTKHGLDDGIFKSNDETGKIFGMTGESIRLAIGRIEKLIGAVN